MLLSEKNIVIQPALAALHWIRKTRIIRINMMRVIVDLVHINGPPPNVVHKDTTSEYNHTLPQTFLYQWKRSACQNNTCFKINRLTDLLANQRKKRAQKRTNERLIKLSKRKLNGETIERTNKLTLTGTCTKNQEVGDVKIPRGKCAIWQYLWSLTSDFDEMFTVTRQYHPIQTLELKCRVTS